MKNEKRVMSKRVKTAYYLNILIVLTGFVFGFRYLFSQSLMQYQLQAMGLSSWTEVIPEYRGMLMTFLRVAGLGMTTASTGMAIILFTAYSRCENWSRWGFAGIFSVHYLPLMGNMYHIKATTAANPPFIPNIIAAIIVVVSLILSSGMDSR